MWNNTDASFSVTEKVLYVISHLLIAHVSSNVSTYISV